MKTLRIYAGEEDEISTLWLISYVLGYENLFPFAHPFKGYVSIPPYYTVAGLNKKILLRPVFSYLSVIEERDFHKRVEAIIKNSGDNFATLLSGGLDSLYLTLRTREIFGDYIPAYSLITMDPVLGERQEIVETLGEIPGLITNWVPVVFEEKRETLLDIINSFIENMKLAPSHNSVFLIYYLFSKIKERKILDGQGADQFFSWAYISLINNNILCPLVCGTQQRPSQIKALLQARRYFRHEVVNNALVELKELHSRMIFVPSILTISTLSTYITEWKTIGEQFQKEIIFPFVEVFLGNIPNPREITSSKLSKPWIRNYLMNYSKKVAFRRVKKGLFTKDELWLKELGPEIKYVLHSDFSRRLFRRIPPSPQTVLRIYYAYLLMGGYV